MPFAISVRAILRQGHRHKSSSLSPISRARWLSNNNNNDHFYDSQSGQYIPTHDENRVTAYLRRCVAGASSTRVISATDVRSTIEDARQMKMMGAIIMHPSSHGGVAISSGGGDGSEDEALEVLDGEMDGAFTLFHPRLDLPHGKSISGNSYFEYTGHDSPGNKELDALQNDTTHGEMSIGIFCPTYYNDENPVVVASGIASLIDHSCAGKYILLCPNGHVDDDEMVQLCEELSYLDVTGAIMKSRLIVSMLSDEQAEECMTFGISKYFVDDASALDKLRIIVEEQGKELVLG